MPNNTITWHSIDHTDWGSGGDISTSLADLPTGWYVVNSDKDFWVGAFPTRDDLNEYLREFGTWRSDRVVYVERLEGPHQD